MNAFKTTTLALVAVIIAPVAAAQIYKCEGPDGPIFSDQECESDAAKVTLSETSGLGGQVSIPTDIDLAKKKLDREKRRYIGRLNEWRDDELAAIDTQIAALNFQKSRASDTEAGEAYAAAIDTQIAALRTSRSNVINSYREQRTKVETTSLKIQPE